MDSHSSIEEANDVQHQGSITNHLILLVNYEVATIFLSLKV